MKRILVLIMSLLFASMISTCMSPKESFIKKGAVKLTPKEIEKAYRGNTVKGPSWAAYYREDGARIVDVPSQDKTYQRRWWLDADGKFCETSTKGSVNCDQEVFRLGDQYKIFAGGKVYGFKIITGNPLKLSK